jgi:hypothetical protein
VTSNARLVGDVNGDGKDDACAYWGDTGTWSIALSTGTGFLPPTNWMVGLGLGSRRQFLADVDGNGRADAVAEHANGDWWVALAGASSFQPIQHWGTALSGGAGDIALCADVNGDGAADAIIVDGASGWTRVAPSLARHGVPAFAGPGWDGWQVTIPLTLDPGLIGLQVAVQAATYPSSRPVGYDISNALHERLH